MQEFDENYWKIRILQAESLAYPVVERIRGGFSHPLLVYTESEMIIPNFVQQLQGYGIPAVISISDTPKEIKRALQKIPYHTAIFRFSTGRYAKENLQLLDDFCMRLGGDVRDRALVIVVAAGPVEDVYAKHFCGTVFIKKDDLPVQMSKQQTEQKFQRTLIETVRNRWRELCDMPTDETCESGEKVFALSANILQSMFPDAKNEIQQALLIMKYEWKNSSDPQLWLDAFCSCLDDYAPQIFGIRARNKVLGADLEYLGELVFFDEVYYYFPLEIFTQICKNLRCTAGIDYIKSQLSKAGALVGMCHGRNYWTYQMEICTSYGAIISKRAIKLKRASLDHYGQLTFQEKMENREEVNNDGKIGQGGSGQSDCLPRCRY